MQYYDDDRNANAASANELSLGNNLSTASRFEKERNEQSERASSSLANSQYGNKEDGSPSGRQVFIEIATLNPLALGYLTNFKLIIARSYPYAVAQRSRAGPRAAKAPLRESYALGAALSLLRGPPPSESVCIRIVLYYERYRA